MPLSLDFMRPEPAGLREVCIQLSRRLFIQIPEPDKLLQTHSLRKILSESVVRNLHQLHLRTLFQKMQDGQFVFLRGKCTG